MGDLPIEEALYRLIYHADYRGHFLAGRLDRLGLDPQDLAALAAVDKEQLVAAATRARADVLRRRHRGSGTPLDLFAMTLHGVDLDPFLEGFLASDSFRACSEVGGGTCIEEAVFRYCEETGIGDPAVREAEWLTALMTALVVNANPEFTVPARRQGGGWVEMRRGVVYAAVDGKLVVGPVPAGVAAIVALGHARAAIDAGMPPDVVDRVAHMGLIDPDSVSRREATP
ncbi:MAG: hypothetical protein EXR71_10625 [Myxococcales bacterium]|nr:hypothetical protein [Myxococcales bacterium]